MRQRRWRKLPPPQAADLVYIAVQPGCACVVDAVVAQGLPRTRLRDQIEAWGAVVVTARTHAKPFLPIYVRCAPGLSYARAKAWAVKRVNRVAYLKGFDYRAFSYNPTTGRAVFI